MDKIYMWIFVLIIFIITLSLSESYFKRKSEEKENFGNRWTDGISNPFYEENRLVEYVKPITSNSVNLNMKDNNPAHAQFSNFTTNGVTPPFIKCPSCQLQFGCANYPYEVDDKNESVCSNCIEKIYMDENNFPVYARSNGRPRTCRNLTGPTNEQLKKATVPLWGTDAKYLTKLQSV